MTDEGLCAKCSTEPCAEHVVTDRQAVAKRTLKLSTALNQRVRFDNQDPDEQFYPARCGDGKHYWHEDADSEGDTCNCGAWYRFADRIEETPR